MTLRGRVILAVPPGSEGEARTIRERARRLGFARFARLSGDLLRVEGLRGRLRIRILGTPGELAKAYRTAPAGQPLVIRWRSDRVIPLEGALAEAKPGRPIWVVAGAAVEVPAALGALERGADAVVLSVGHPEELPRLEELLDEPRVGRLRWSAVRVERVEPVGLGDRVLVDTTSLLAPDEGLLVGSRAAFLFNITSEAIGSRFSGPRPFRVNAGAAHSYLLRSDGTTRYLSELAPGDPVLVARRGAVPRSVRVGRIKIERRPLVLVEAEHRGSRPTVFVQEAETVRLAGAQRPIPVTELRPGDRVLGVRLPPARHLGTVVGEFLEER